MGSILDLVGGGWLPGQAAQFERWLNKSVLIPSVGWQVAATLLALVVARLLTPPLRRLVALGAARWPWRDTDRLKNLWWVLHLLALPALWMGGQWLATMAFNEAAQPHRLTQTVASLLTAWLVIRLSTTLLADRTWSRLVAAAAWALAALDITGLLDGTIHVLDRVGIDFGDSRLSLLLAIKAFVSLSLLLWLSGALSRLMEKRISALPNLTPSAQVLFIKITKVTLVTLGGVVALKSVGIDLSALAVLSGAIGLGVGFGLQKVVSNLISGWILLLDKSIKPGDVIGLGDGYGWIQSLGARYVSVITTDGIEHLIPNEELITQRVQNWSFSHNKVRLKIPVGVAYDTDLRKAMALCVEAARTAPRILAEPEPICLFTGFGDSALNLEVRCWIDDPKNGVTIAKSGVLLGIWERFQAAGIEVPFPQQELRIKRVEGNSRTLPVD